MKFVIAILYVVLSFCLCINIYGQNREMLDSLWKEYYTAGNDTIRIKLLIEEIGYSYENISADSAILYYSKAIDIANKNLSGPTVLTQGEKHFFELHKAHSLRYIGIVHYSQGAYNKAIEYYLRALKISEELNDKNGMAGCYNSIGLFYANQSSYDKALSYYLKALKIKQESGDIIGMSICYNNMGSVYQHMGSYDKAIEYYLKSLNIKEKSGDKKGMSTCYNNIGNVFFYQGSYNKAMEYYLKSLKINEELGDQNGLAMSYSNIGNIHVNPDDYDNAIEYFLKALKIYEELGNKQQMSTNYNNIGNVYYYQGGYDKAIEYYLKALRINEELGDKKGIVTSYVNIASVDIILSDSAALSENQRLNYLHEAIEYATNAIELAQKIKVLPEESEAANTLMITYKKLGNFKKSVEYAEIFIATKDSMFSEEKTKALAQMQAQYEAEKRELTIQKLEKEKQLQNETIARKNEESKKQRILIFSFLAGFIIILVFSIFLYRLFLQKKKANVIIARKNQSLQIAFAEINTQKEEITSQRDEIEAQRDKLSEQNHILAEQKKEITNSINYAKRIQQAVLPNMAEMLRLKSQNPNLKSQDPLEFGALNLVYRQAGLEFESFVLFKPKDIVSGDFYWATRINEWLIVTVADCTGHGVPGAFMSMLGVSFLNEIVRKKEITKASEVLDHLRESIIEALQQKGDMGEQKDGMDITLCALNTTNNQLQVACANNPLFIVNANIELKEIPPDLSVETNALIPKATLIEVKADKMPVGIQDKMNPFTNHEIHPCKGDTLYLCSDGYQDQFGGEKSKKFMSKRLKELFVTIYDKPMNEQRNVLDATFENWKGKQEQIDDVTVLGLRV